MPDGQRPEDSSLRFKASRASGAISHAALSYYYPQAELAACFRPCIQPAATAGESDYDGVLILAIGAADHA